MGPIILDIDNTDIYVRREIMRTLPLAGVWGIKIGNLILDQGLTGVTDYIAGRVNLFVDLKHTDVHNRMQSILELYREMGRYAPDYVSVDGGVSMSTLAAIVDTVHKPAIVMIPLRSDQSEADCVQEYKEKRSTMLIRRLRKAEAAHVSAVTCPSWALPHTGWLARGAFSAVIATGVRSEGVHAGEHIDPLSPEKALEFGATHVVIGREVIKAPDPLAALHALATRCMPTWKVA